MCPASRVRPSIRDGAATRAPGPMHLALDQRRGCAGQRRVADGVAVRPAADAGGDAHDVKAGRRRVRPDRAVPLSARAGATRSVRGFLTDRGRRPSSAGAIRRSPTARSSCGATACFGAADRVGARRPRRTTSRCSRSAATILRRYRGRRLAGARAVVAAGDRRRDAAHAESGRRRLRADARAARRRDRESSTVRTAPGRRCAGAGSRSRASAWCSFTAIGSTPRSASTSAPARRIQASRGDSDFSIATPPTSSSQVLVRSAGL